MEASIRIRHQKHSHFLLQLYLLHCASILWLLRSDEVKGFAPPSNFFPLKYSPSIQSAFSFSSIITIPQGKCQQFGHNSKRENNKNYSNNKQSVQKYHSSQLFGIKGLHIWFDSQFPEAIVDIGSPRSTAENSRKQQKSYPKSKASSSNPTPSHVFDHVLIDVNQILHITFRRSRGNHGLAIRLLMSELDAILQIATPRKSVVLAVDGPPPAAKLATQRRRRFSTLVRTRWKLQHFDKLKGISKSVRARRYQSYQLELESLKLTPATDFMVTMEEALLYWAWQRLQRKDSSYNRVRFYISSSKVPGEGETKLLEWVLSQQQLLQQYDDDNTSNYSIRGDTIAMCGRDSDLLLEGLLLPPYYTTHNTFVIRQKSGQSYDCVSLWETTRALYNWLPSNAPPNQILQMRLDFTVIMMINGNDYLPKLRGCNGFSKVCSIYRSLLKKHFEDAAKHTTSTIGLIHPDSLEYNLDFSIDFFQKISDMTPQDVWEGIDNGSTYKKTPLSSLNNIMETGFVPSPMRFQIIETETNDDDDTENYDEDDADIDLSDDQDYDLEDATATDDQDVEVKECKKREDSDADADADEDDCNEGEDEDDYNEDEDDYNEANHDYNEVDDDESDGQGRKELIRLTLGKPGSEEFLSYDYWKEPDESFKEAKHKLATMALDDFMGTDYEESDESFYEDLGITSSGYAWEVPRAIEGKVDTYLGGILWNIQTYQDGLCADYGYNYGRRMSPNAADIVEFFQQAKAENRTVGRRELIGDGFRGPVSAGLSCLAALPTQLINYVPEPYRLLPEESVEKCYERCVDPVDNSFDLKKFERLIERKIKYIQKTNNDTADEKVAEWNDNEINGFSGRRIILGDHYWTVVGKSKERLAHPFEPPNPPLDSFSRLRRNDRIRSSRMFPLETPRPRSVWGKTSLQQTKKHRYRRQHNPAEICHSDLGALMKGCQSILDVEYEIAFQLRKRLKKKREPITSEDFSLDSTDMKPMSITLNADGQPAFAVLKQLEDAGLVGGIDHIVTPFSGDRNLGSFQPEETRLIVRPAREGSVIKDQLEYSKQRNANSQSKQAFKHYLASLALADIVGPDHSWEEMTWNDLRDMLKQSN